MNKKIYAALFAAALLVACSNNEQTTSEGQDTKPQVKIAVVHAADIAQTGTFTATVESDIKNNISPNANYRIEKILVDVGDNVAKGQVLVQLDASNLRQLELQIENQKLEYNRTKALYEVGGASKSEYDNVKMQLDVLETQLRQMKINTQLLSPISGIVTARNYDNGDMYTGSPILTIEQTNPVKLIINVSEIYYKQVTKGMNVDLTIDAYEGESFTGKITIVYPTIDTNTHTFPVEITIDNKQQKIRPGMYARATINYGDQRHVLVPDAAIVKQIGAGDRYVFVYNEGKVSYNKVELGKQIGDMYEVYSGVEDGDRVVIAGQTKLIHGSAVEIIK